MTFEGLISILEDFGVPSAIRETCIYLFDSGEWEALQAVLNAIAEDPEGLCREVDPASLDEAPQASPEEWARGAALRILRALRKVAGPPWVESVSVFVVARLIEEEFERRQAELAKEAARGLWTDDPGFESDPGPEEPDDDLP